MNDYRSRDARFILIALGLFALLAIATHRWVLAGRIPFASDLLAYFPPWQSTEIQPKQHSEIGDSATLFYPWRVFQAANLRQGTIPLWNPLILGGTPFLGETQSALFYPLHLTYLFLPNHVAWTVNLLLNMVLAGAFTAWFVRDLGASRVGAIASGVIFCCCGFVTAFQTFSSLADTLIWLPFVFWAVHRLCMSPSIPFLALTAAGFALTVLAGHPETTLHVALSGALFGLWLCVVEWRGAQTTSRLSLLTAAGLLSVGLSFVQVVPTFEWVEHINMSSETRWPARPLHEILALVSRDITRDPNSDGMPIPEAASYVAPLAILLAPLAFFHRNRRMAVFFVLVILVAVQMIWQKGPVHWIIAELPILQRMKNYRVIFLIDFSVAVLAGLGLTVLSEASAVKAGLRKYGIFAVGLCAAAIVLGILALPHPPLPGGVGPTKWYFSPKATFALLAAGAILVFTRLVNLIDGKKFAVAALAVLFVDMGTFRSFDLPYAKTREMFPDVPLYGFLKSQDLSQYRVAVVDGTMASNFSMVYGVPEVGGYDFELKLAADFLGDFGRHEEAAITLLSEPVSRIADRRLDLMNVKYVIANTFNASAQNLAAKPDRFSLAFSEGAVRVFENKNVLPRVRFFRSSSKTIEVIPDLQAQLNRVKDAAFDPEESIILSAMPSGMEMRDDWTVPSKGQTVDILSSNSNELVLRVNQNQSGLLQVGQIFYPGWRAFADGQEVPVLRANFALVAIALAKGASTVRLVFDPPSYKLGLSVTLATLLVLAILLGYQINKTLRIRRTAV